tara:strand:- start:156 stop:461 length:306 start_codon:yes stop_codon:yes gene_type:complete
MYKEKIMYLVGDSIIDINQILHISPDSIEFIPANSTTIDITEEEYKKLFKVLMKEVKFLNPEDYVIDKLDNKERRNKRPLLFPNIKILKHRRRIGRPKKNK